MSKQLNAGRGRGGFRRNNNGFKFGKKGNEKIYKFATQLNKGSKNYASYSSVVEKIVQEFQDEFGTDVAKSLKNMEMIDLDEEEPERKISSDENEAKKKQEQAGYDILYQELLGRFLDRKQKYEENMMKAFNKIFKDYMTKGLQLRVEEHPDFKDEIDDKPIKLLEVIKELMHEPVRAQYHLISMTNNLQRWLNAKQNDDEPLLEYAKRYQQLTDVVKSQFGTKLLSETVEKRDEYKELKKTAEKKEMIKDSFDEWCAYLVLQGADKNKYGTLMSGFVNQFSLGNDQYPKTVSAAIDALSNHRFDSKYYENREKRFTNKPRKSGYKSDNEEEDRNNASFMLGTKRREKLCYCCGKKGHLSPDCNERKNIPRQEWYVNKVLQAAQTDEHEDNGDEDSDNESVTSSASTSTRKNKGQGQSKSRGRDEWNHFQHAFHYSGFQRDVEISGAQSKPFEHLQGKWILDTGSTLRATICNPDLCENI